MIYDRGLTLNEDSTRLSHLIRCNTGSWRFSFLFFSALLYAQWFFSLSTTERTNHSFYFYDIRRVCENRKKTHEKIQQFRRRFSITRIPFTTWHQVPLQKWPDNSPQASVLFSLFFCCLVLFYFYFTLFYFIFCFWKIRAPAFWNEDLNVSGPLNDCTRFHVNINRK